MDDDARRAAGTPGEEKSSVMRLRRRRDRQDQRPDADLQDLSPVMHGAEIWNAWLDLRTRRVLVLGTLLALGRGGVPPARGGGVVRSGFSIDDLRRCAPAGRLLRRAGRSARRSRCSRRWSTEQMTRLRAKA